MQSIVHGCSRQAPEDAATELVVDIQDLYRRQQQMLPERPVGPRRQGRAAVKPLPMPLNCARPGCARKNCTLREATEGDVEPEVEVGPTLDLTSHANRKPERHRQDRGITAYSAGPDEALRGPPLRRGEVWYLPLDDVQNFHRVTLMLHANGIAIVPENECARITASWSPFSMAQACRLHSVQADDKHPWMRLFKVSIFHHGITHLFAVEGKEASSERARWIADIARALRMLTQSLFPRFTISTQPLPNAEWTATRLIAGYMLMCDSQGVSVVYCELHTQWESMSAFVAYEDEFCDSRLLNIQMTMHTGVSERVGVDCSCFIIDAHHFSARSSAEKVLWLRAISNVKVKIRHCVPNPTFEELTNYRESIRESVRDLKTGDVVPDLCPLLPRRNRPWQAGGDAPDPQRLLPTGHPARELQKPSSKPITGLGLSGVGPSTSPPPFDPDEDEEGAPMRGLTNVAQTAPPPFDPEDSEEFEHEEAPAFTLGRARGVGDGLSQQEAPPPTLSRMIADQARGSSNEPRARTRSPNPPMALLAGGPVWNSGLANLDFQEGPDSDEASLSTGLTPRPLTPVLESSRKPGDPGLGLGPAEPRGRDGQAVGGLLHSTSLPRGTPPRQPVSMAPERGDPVSPESWIQVTRYLPMSMDGKRLFSEERPGRFRLNNDVFQTPAPGVAYRVTKSLHDRDDLNYGPDFNTIVNGVDEGNGWLRTEIRIKKPPHSKSKVKVQTPPALPMYGATREGERMVDYGRHPLMCAEADAAGMRVTSLTIRQAVKEQRQLSKGTGELVLSPTDSNSLHNGLFGESTPGGDSENDCSPVDISNLVKVGGSREELKNKVPRIPTAECAATNGSPGHVLPVHHPHRSAPLPYPPPPEMSPEPPSELEVEKAVPGLETSENEASIKIPESRHAMPLVSRPAPVANQGNPQNGQHCLIDKEELEALRLLARQAQLGQAPHLANISGMDENGMSPRHEGCSGTGSAQEHTAFTERPTFNDKPDKAIAKETAMKRYLKLLAWCREE
eukprot:TRINITY_DN46828_c0_g2_i1.p1 TRINITY_DN46828_c0_g2~~TRINITY_DN46828_c0_g2_i1.p1  ORF type:complete len:1017 (+),score=179.37 TRINITY_DN46828_c0_g2_i1:192-3242(+)